MSFVIQVKNQGPIRYTEFDLPIATTLRVPAHSVVAIPHEVELVEVEEGCLCWLVRAPDAFSERHLSIDQGPIPLGEVITHALHLSHSAAYHCVLRKGSSISRLVSMPIL